MGNCLWQLTSLSLSLSLSEPHLFCSLCLSSLSLSLMSVCHVGEGSSGLLHAASATHHTRLTLCNAFMPTDPSLEVMMSVACGRTVLSAHIREQEPPVS